MAAGNETGVRIPDSMESDEQHILEDVGSEKKPVLSAHRRFACSHSDFRDKYQFVKPPSKGVLQTVTDAGRAQCNCSHTLSSHFWWRCIKRRLPILEWIQYYSIRQNLLCDIIAGITVGVMHIPQGMAYAMLANVPPVIGLYVSLFPVIIYVFMGTSRHISIGTFAVLCLMLSKSVDRYATTPDHATSMALELTMTSNQTLMLENNLNETTILGSYSAIEVAVVVGFTVGAFQLLMGVLHLGSLSVYLSDTLISGFTTGAATHVFTSQVKNLFGFSIPAHNGLFKIVYTYKEIFSVIPTANYASMIVSFLTIVTLVVVNEFINPHLKAKCKVFLPTELLVIIFGTLSSYFIEFNAKYVVNIIGFIPTGLPNPISPRFELIPDVLADSFAIAVVGFTIGMSMAKLFAKKHKYDIDPNQELLALGTGNVISSFFSCFPCSASLSRSLIQEGTGGKTQVAGLVSCIFLLVIILVVGPLFEHLPNCILSSIIVVALKGMFKQFNDLVEIWKVSKLEALVWIITFCGVVLTDVDLGLAIGIAASMLAVVVRSQRPYACLLGQVPGTDVYLDISKYKTAKEELGIKLFRFSSSLYYANREYFRDKLFVLIGINPHALLIRQEKRKIINQIKQEVKIQKRTKQRTEFDSAVVHSMVHVQDMIRPEICHPNNSSNLACPIQKSAFNPSIIPSNNEDENAPTMGIQHIVLDCSTWSFIDTAGIVTLIQIIEEYGELGIRVHLACCPDTMIETIENHRSYHEVFEKRIFPSIPDAKAFILDIGFQASTCETIVLYAVYLSAGRTKFS